MNRPYKFHLFSYFLFDLFHFLPELTFDPIFEIIWFP